MLLIHSACVGAVLTLLGKPESQRDPGLSEAAREAAIAAITGESPVGEASGRVGAALALRADLDQVAGLSAGERLLLDELLVRIAGG
ncbi:MAG: hypothetical protein ACREP7_22170 [Lysobacter sp.]